MVTLAPIAKINKMNGPFSPLICLRRVNPQSRQSAFTDNRLISNNTSIKLVAIKTRYF